MSRIRSIHPGIWTDETFAALSDAAFRLYVGLLTEADDGGIFEWKPLQLRMKLRPGRDGPVDTILNELEDNDVICGFALGGKLYGAIRNFCKYQKPKFPKFVHPTSSEIADYVGSSATPAVAAAGSTPSPTVEARVEPGSIPRNAEKRLLMERRREEGEEEGDLNSRKKNSVSEIQKETNGAVLSETLSALVKRAAKKVDRSAYVWLKPTDTRVDRAQKWWRENYGSELPVQHEGTKQGYRVPWAAVR